MSLERDDARLPSSDALTILVLGKRNVVDLSCSPDDDSVILRSEREGRVSSHRSRDDAEVVSEAIPDITKRASLKVPGAACQNGLLN